ncbi:unnamed protein product [Trichobilharzia szidati]|nr:unnamed protein product [Trichobilharzia szidati]
MLQELYVNSLPGSYPYDEDVNDIALQIWLNAQEVSISSSPMMPTTVARNYSCSSSSSTWTAISPANSNDDSQFSDDIIKLMHKEFNQLAFNKEIEALLFVFLSISEHVLYENASGVMVLKEFAKSASISLIKFMSRIGQLIAYYAINDTLSENRISQGDSQKLLSSQIYAYHPQCLI